MKMHKALSLILIATFTLVGCGGGDNTGSQAVQMNKLPIADAGQIQNMLIGDLVTLDGSKSSDEDGDALTFKWTLTSKPTASLSVLSNSTSAMPTFTADVAGTYVASLTVFDKKDYSNPATVTITAAAANAAPVANAGVAQSVTTGMPVTLDGSKSSDANGDKLTYKWTLTSKPSGSTATLSSTTAERPTFVADVAGAYVASLKVNDGRLDSNVSNVSVTATQPKIIGTAYKATNGMSVTLVSFTTENLGNGYTRYTATYKQQNDTAVAIDEGTLRLYFTNAGPQAQYGSFNKVLPGESFALTRSYRWEVLTASTTLLLQYHEDHFFAENPINGALQWIFPLK